MGVVTMDTDTTPADEPTSGTPKAGAEGRRLRAF
jgi:hypothetical protein